MSVKVMSLVWERGPFEGGSLLVMLALADWANDEGECWPSVPTIAEKARMGERNARYVLKKLEGDGWLGRAEGRGRRHSNTYFLNLQKLQALPQRKKGQKVRGSAASERVQSAPLKPATRDTKPATAFAPEPSVEPSTDPSNLNYMAPAASGACEKPKSSRRLADPRSHHPAIEAVRRLMSRYPDKLFWDEFIEMLGEGPDVERLAECRRAWRARGWNGNSIDWVYWYRDGIPWRNGNGDQRSDGSPGSGRASRPDAARQPVGADQGAYQQRAVKNRI
jgi:hypothetical protein